MLYCVYTVNEIQRFHRQPKQNTTTVVKTFTCKTDAIETLERLHTHMCENNPWYKVAAHAIFDEDGEDQLLRYSGDNDASGLSIELRIEKLELAKPIKTYEPVTLPSITDEINDNLEHVLGNGGTREVLIESVLQRAGFEYVLNRLLIDPPSRKAILERALLDNGGVTFRNLLIKDECAREVLIDRMQEGLGLGEITAQFLLDPGHREELLQSMFNQSPENIRECIVVEALENQEVLKVISTQLVRKLGAKSLAADIIKDSYARTELLELLTFGDARLKTVHETLDDHTARDELVQKLLDDNYDGSVTRAVIHHKEARKDLVEKLYLDKADAGGCCTVSALRGDFKVADALTDLKNEIAGQRGPTRQNEAREIIASLMQHRGFRNTVSKQAKDALVGDLCQLISSEVQSAVASSSRKRSRSEESENHITVERTSSRPLGEAIPARLNQSQAQTTTSVGGSLPANKRARTIEVIEVD